MDMEAALKLYVKYTKDPEWKKALSFYYEQCNQGISERIEEFQKRSNFTKEECNIKYIAIPDCYQIAMFHVRFSFSKINFHVQWLVFLRIALRIRGRKKDNAWKLKGLWKNATRT